MPSALATRTGLTPQAVSNVLARLTSAGLLEPLGVRRNGVGKPPTMHQLRDTARQAVGAHVTRRGLRLTRVDLRGRVRSRLWYDLPHGFALATPSSTCTGPAAFADATDALR
jgi:hypothetical protein